MARLPPRPDLTWPDAGAIPYAREHDDVYFSGEGLSEKRAVFLTGCGLPEAWAGRDRFSVGELGFGTGLNFLVLWDLWRRHQPFDQARLDYLTFEGALIAPADAARIHAAWPELADLSAQLRANWPDRARGVQRIHLAHNVTLTIAIGDIAETLPQARGSIEAWFLDGFAPSKNAGMWSAGTLGEVARLSAANACAATYTVAGEVRRNLEAAGFSLAKMPGHGRKKERLEARLTAVRGPPRAPPRRIAIIGAGIAGACAAHAFVRRGCEVHVYDQAEAPGAGASGNPLALVMPRLDAADSPAARALVEAWLYARRFYPALGPDAAEALEAIHLPRGEKEALRFARLLSDPPLDESLLRPSGSGLAHLGAVAVRPRVALSRLLEGATLRFKARIASLAEIEADMVVVCAGMGLTQLVADAPPLTGRLGQVECALLPGPASALADGGYVVQAFGDIVFGATFEAADGEPEISERARAQNLETLARLRPDLVLPGLASRAAIRATTPDRFPFAGPPPQKQKAPDGTPAPSVAYRLIGGLGSRGFLWAPLLAESVASEAFGEPSPVETSVADCLDPGRFLARSLRRGG